MRPNLAALALMAGCAAPQQAAVPPGPDAARAWALAGPYACAEGPVRWTVGFAPDGAYAYEHDGARVAGTWRIDGSGRMCTADEVAPDEQCYGLALAGRSAQVTRPNGDMFRCDPV